MVAVWLDKQSIHIFFLWNWFIKQKDASFITALTQKKLHVLDFSVAEHKRVPGIFILILLENLQDFVLIRFGQLQKHRLHPLTLNKEVLSYPGFFQ